MPEHQALAGVGTRDLMFEGEDQDFRKSLLPKHQTGIVSNCSGFRGC
jgi:hypothetical protein